MARSLDWQKDVSRRRVYIQGSEPLDLESCADELGRHAHNDARFEDYEEDAEPRAVPPPDERRPERSRCRYSFDGRRWAHLPPVYARMMWQFDIAEMQLGQKRAELERLRKLPLWGHLLAIVETELRRKGAEVAALREHARRRFVLARLPVPSQLRP